MGVRQGLQSIPGAPGFGYLHALLDHNIDEETIGTAIVNNVAGIYDSPNRYLYGLKFEVEGNVLIRVEVIEQRTPSVNFDDGYAFGVVTAYCKGYDVCPDSVNETLP